MKTTVFHMLKNTKEEEEGWLGSRTFKKDYMILRTYSLNRLSLTTRAPAQTRELPPSLRTQGKRFRNLI